MCHLMETYAEITIERKAHRLVQDRIREKIELKRIVINPEPSVRLRQSRNSLIRQDDEVHPLHWYLLAHPMVYWKPESKNLHENLHRNQTAQYADFLNRPANESDPELNRQFLQWIAKN